MTLKTLAISLLVVGLLGSIGSAQDSGIPDTVRIDSIQTATNAQGILPVHFFNDEELAGIEITVIFSSPDIVVDSFSFAGSRVDYIAAKGTFDPLGGYTIYCFPFSSEPPIAPGTGLFGTFYLSWDIGVLPQQVTVDSITIVSQDITYSTTFSDIDNHSFAPQFVPGFIDIQQGFGCCVGITGDYDNNGSDEPNVSDLTFLIDYLFRGGPPSDCPEETDVNGSGSTEPNVADLTYMIDFLFRGGPPPVSCQP
jgi:hypothetical protein